MKNSAHVDEGPCSQVRACGTLHSPSIDVNQKISAHGSVESLLNNSPNPSKVVSKDSKFYVFWYCHTRPYLPISAKLKIWQVSACKMGPRSGIISIKNHLDLFSVLNTYWLCCQSPTQPQLKFGVTK